MYSALVVDNTIVDYNIDLQLTSRLVSVNT